MREYLTLEQLKKFSQEKIERLQNLRFKATARYMLPAVPFYAKLFKTYNVDPYSLAKIEDWHDKGLPLIKKATYMKNPMDFVVAPDTSKIFQQHLDYLACQHEFATMANLLAAHNKKEQIKKYYSPKMLVFSGGTESGNPTPVLLTATQKFDTLMGVLKLIGDLLIKNKDERTVGMNLFPYAPHLGWHAVHHALDINADLNLCTAAGGAIPTERLVALADKAKPNVICGMNEYLRNRFLPLAIERKIKLPERVIFINGAQKMLESERERITELARKVGVKQSIVLDLYGASELKEALMPECKPGSGFHHMAPLSTIVKTIKTEYVGKDLIEEWNFSRSGYAASWNIDGAGTLLSGYVLGDKFDSVTQGCEHCKLNVMLIHNVNRIREIEAQLKMTGIVEEKIKGTRVNLVAIRDAALQLKEVKEAQVYLNRKKGILELRVVSDSKKTLAKLQEIFVTTEIKPKLVLTKMEKLYGDKLKFEPIKIE